MFDDARYECQLNSWGMWCLRLLFTKSRGNIQGFLYHECTQNIKSKLCTHEKGKMSSRNKATAQLQLRNWCLFVPSDSFPAVLCRKRT